MRHTRGHTGNRRSHHALVATDLALCSNCGQPTPKHLVCKNCGWFKGRMVIDMAAQIDKKVAKTQKAKA